MDWWFVAYVVIALMSGVILGAILIFIGWFIHSKLRDKIEKKQIPVEEIAKQVEVTKPNNDQKEVEEYGRYETNKIRQFEKLRRAVATTQPVNSIYSRNNENERRSSIQNRPADESKYVAKPTEEPKRESRRVVKLD